MMPLTNQAMPVSTHNWSEPPDLIALTPETVDVWLFPLQQSSVIFDQMHNTLSSDEKLKASRLKNTTRSHYIVSRSIIRILLGKYLNDEPESLVFKKDAHGKPSLDTHSSHHVKEPLHFNLSHSHEYGLLAVSSDRAVGVDLEYNHRHVQYMKVAKRFFAPTEFKTLQGTAQTLQKKAFFAGWCRKEALLKAIGTGIAGGLDRIEVSMSTETKSEIIKLQNQLHTDSNAHATNHSSNHFTNEWCIQKLPVIDSYTHAVAAEETGWTLRCFTWDDSLVKKFN